MLSAHYALNHLDADLPSDDHHGGPAHPPTDGGPHGMTHGDTEMRPTTTAPLLTAR
ncbi:hypothetical protein STENM327S_01131 [Streptomyces tendae]